MTLRDPMLDDAVQALRALGDEDADVAADMEGTRARVLASLGRRKQVGRMLATLAVVGAISLSSTAALGWYSGWIPAAWRTIRGVPEEVVPPAPEVVPEQKRSAASKRRSVLARDEASPVETPVEIPAATAADMPPGEALAAAATAEAHAGSELPAAPRSAASGDTIADRTAERPTVPVLRAPEKRGLDRVNEPERSALPQQTPGLVQPDTNTATTQTESPAAQAPSATTDAEAPARLERGAVVSSVSGAEDAPRPAVPGTDAEPPSDAELADYRVAHALHFDERDAARALAAWDRYLVRWPKGRLAIEARYNRALALVRLGRTDDAIAALQPFANGAQGGYRREEARRLLRVLSSGARP